MGGGHFGSPPTMVAENATRARVNHLNLAAPNLDLCDVDWEEVFTASTVENQWAAFVTRFLPIVDNHAPLRKLTIQNPTAPPVSPATRDIMFRRRTALVHSGLDSAEYRELNRTVRSAVRSDRRSAVQREIGERGPSGVWRSIRTVVAGKRDGRSVQPDATADRLNEIFISVGPRVAGELTARGPVTATDTRLPREGACSFGLSRDSGDAQTHGLRHAELCSLRR